jgi:branched-chain amino acid transport system permease protein
VLAQSVTRRPNLAHGAVFAFGGQVLVLAAVQGYVVLWMTMPAAIAFGSAVSVVLSTLLVLIIAKSILPRLTVRTPNAVIVTTLGLAICITEAARIGADTRELWLPPLLADRLEFTFLPGDPGITTLQALSIVVIVAILMAGDYVLRFTGWGRALRAVADDPKAAALSGVNVSLLITGTVLASGAIAAVTGMIAVLYYGNMSFSSGMIFSLKVLFLAAAGGFSNPLHAALAAFAYALSEGLWDSYMPIVWRDAVFYSFLALTLILRPETRT